MDRPKWERILWASQPYPDNYVPEDFLKQLKTDRELVARFPTELAETMIANYMRGCYC